MKLVDHVQTALEPYRESKLIVAVSGGLDSMALLDILLQVRPKLDLELVVAHADHGLRKRSAKDERFVHTVAVGHGLTYHSTNLGLRGVSNVEAKAREARYTWLEKIRQQEKADYIVTAHQADDQVETLFLHLARGSGLAGLAGMQPQTGNLLRPLLDVPRSKLARYGRRRDIAYRLDPTNKSLKFARNRVRRQIITSLQKINPQLVETVSQSMRVLGDEYEVVRTLAEHELTKTTMVRSATVLELDAAKLRRLKRGLRHLVWRESIRDRLGNLQGIRLTHMENLDDLLKRQAGSLIHLPHGLVAHRRSASVALKIQDEVPPPSPQELSIPGEVRFGEVVVRARATSPAALPVKALIARHTVGQQLVVRSPKTGDRLRPVGMRGSKLVSDLLTDAKVPRDERPWVPVVTTAEGDIVWVAGYRADRRFVAASPGEAIELSLSNPIQ